MTRRIAINGFGRIGRMVFRILEDQTDIEVVGINDLTDPKTLAHLLEFDSVHGRFGKNVSAEDGAIIVGDRRVPTFAQRNPAEIPWGDLGVELVLSVPVSLEQRYSLRSLKCGCQGRHPKCSSQGRRRRNDRYGCQ